MTLNTITIVYVFVAVSAMAWLLLTALGLFLLIRSHENLTIRESISLSLRNFHIAFLISTIILTQVAGELLESDNSGKVDR